MVSRASALGLACLVASGCGLFRVDPQLDAELRMPDEITVDQAFDLVVDLKNPHEKAVTLDSIDVDSALIKDFQVVKITPTPTDTMRIPVVDQRSWSFGKAVPSQGALQVSFTLRPLKAGHYTGNVEVCNPNQDCTSLYADIAVRAKP